MIVLKILVFLLACLLFSTILIGFRYLLILQEEKKKIVKNLCEENDRLMKVNYKLAKETNRRLELISEQEKIISKLADEVQTYRNSFNNN